MTRTRLFCALLLSTAALVGCRSNDASSTADVDFPCICGTPEGAISCCLHPQCMSGEGNPDNADCVCGTLTLPE